MSLWRINRTGHCCSILL
ncbi:hypothetical protein BDFB_012320 [Asbolus verrucosus]|uniref:Uncharacterized protein n=1 Tax=Asbolus verrucosus TaxID=1661398 RepID=A0A482WDL6_ASBVE|nr:hypothetical protein BDFB_012320 [Asbolus verrucosus]